MRGRDGQRFRPDLLDASVRPGPVALRRRDLPLAAIPVLATVLLSVPCLPEAPADGRVAELATAAVEGRPTPPPLNPLWWLLARLAIAVIPAASPVWCCGLMSVLVAGAAAGLLALWLTQLDLGRRAAVGGSLFLAFGLTGWQLAVVASPLVGVLCLTVAALVTLTQWLATRDARWLAALLAVLIAGTLEHPLFLSTLVVIVVTAPRRWPGAGTLRTSRGSYLALAIVGGAIPAAWGWLAGEPPAGVAVFLDRVDTAEPISPAPGDASSSHPTAAAALVLAVAREHGWIGLPLGALGLAVALRRQGRDALLVVGLLLVPFLVAAVMHALWPGLPVRPEPLAPVVVVLVGLAALVGWGLDALLGRFAIRASLTGYAMGALGALLPLWLALLHHPQVDRSAYTIVADHAAGLLQHLPEDGVLLVGSHPRGGAARHLLRVHGLRPDVLIDDGRGRIAEGEAGGRPRLARQPAVTAQLLARRALLAVQRFPLPEEYRWVTHGLLYRAVPVDSAGPDEASLWERLRFRDIPAEPPPVARPGAPLDAVARRLAAAVYLARSRFLFEHGREHEASALRRHAHSLLRGA